MPEALPDEQLDQIVDYWNAANYLTVGQIYLRDNPLLREPLRPEHIKPRLLGHIPTQEALAAAALLREFLPHLRVRLVNVVDLMTLAHSDEHPHGMAPEEFVRLFTPDTDVVVAFHGYQNALHQLLHGRPRPDRFHVRGFNEQGTTTTPFDMVVLNGVDRYHLALEAVRRSRRAPEGAQRLIDHCNAQLQRHHRYKVEHLQDMPEVRDWTWPGR